MVWGKWVCLGLHYVEETQLAILYVASEASELKPFAETLTGLRKLKWPLDYAFEGVQGSRRIMLAAHGAGPKLAAQAVEVALRAVSVADLSSSKLEAVVTTGYCGALDPALELNQIVVATSVADHVTRQGFTCLPVSSEEPAAEGILLSLDRVVQTAEEKSRLRVSEPAGAIAVDMESAGVAARITRAGLPVCCIKVVTDTAAEGFAIDLNQFRTAEGRFGRGKIGTYAITHPSMIPELFRLKRRSDTAARALGEFLVSCRIEFQVSQVVAGMEASE